VTAGDEYRAKAAELRARARRESDANLRAELDNLALAFLRLAAQAERNNLADIVYETPPKADFGSDEVEK
jgi:hypothetical protein